MLVKYQPKKIKVKGYVNNDCTINSIGAALGISYDLARKLLQTGVYKNKGEIDFYRRNPRTKVEFSMRSNVVRICEAICQDKNVFITEEERRQRLRLSRQVRGLGNNENSVSKFAKHNSKGVFILLAHGHLISIINGVVVDNIDSTNMAVEIAYRINVVQARNVIKELAKFYRMSGPEHYVDNAKEIKSLMEV